MEPAGAKNFTLLEHLPLGVFVLRPDGTVAEWNRCLEQWTGIPRADIVGRPIGDFSERLRRPQYQQRLKAVFQAGAPLILSSQLHGEIVPSVLPDGRRRMQQAMVTALPQSGSGDYWALFAIQDVTDLTHRIQAYRAMRDEAFQAKKLAEQKAEDLKATQHELEQFVYVASHDLQEPVRSLIAYSTLLREDLDEELPEDAATDLDYIAKAAHRMQTLITDLLAFSRAGRAAMKTETVSLDACVDESLEALRSHLEQSGARIERQALPRVVGDATLLTQLYQNLLSNALKFARDGQPVVELTAGQTGDVWTLGVRDNGIGLEPEYAEQIFEPFKRLHGITEYPGTGIGLAICRKSVERHGGRIWVESRPAQGAHFKFTLPNRGNELEPS